MIRELIIETDLGRDVDDLPAILYLMGLDEVSVRLRPGLFLTRTYMTTSVSHAAYGFQRFKRNQLDYAYPVN